MKKFVALFALVLVLAITVNADARPRRCRGGKCSMSIDAVSVQLDAGSQSGQ